MDRGTRKTGGGGVKPSSGREISSSFEIGRKVVHVSGGRGGHRAIHGKQSKTKI